MKYFIKSTLAIVSIIVITACNNSNSNKKNEIEEGYSIEPKTTTISWTAFKTTNKIPVKGTFTKLNIEKTKPAKTALEALNGLKFSIPVSSLFTNDTIRDNKLLKYFFQNLIDTDMISGVLHTNNENSGELEITLNNTTQTVPVYYIISDQMVTMDAVIDLDNWRAQQALNLLNNACLDLHTGPDGVSKTWSEVKISVATYLKHN
jgi:hypothetical protein